MSALDKKLTQLGIAGPLAAANLLYILQGGVPKQVGLDTLLAEAVTFADVYSVAETDALFTSLRNGVSSSFDTLAELAAGIATKQDHSSNLDAWSALAASAKQDHTANLDAWSAITTASKLDASSYTAADVLTKLLTVDGSGSGLDADLLDGLSSAAFGRLSQANTWSAAMGYSGTDHAGIAFNNLTAAQEAALSSPALGSSIFNASLTKARLRTGATWDTLLSSRGAVSPTTAAASFWGYNNVTGASWSAGVVTINFGSAHNYEAGQIALSQDIVPSGYNGTARVKATPTANSITIDMASNPGAYVSGGYVTIEPDVQIRQSGPSVPAAMFCAHPNTVSLGLDVSTPIFGGLGPSNNINNASWALYGDGHTVKIKFGGALKHFSNGFTDAYTSEHGIYWTGSTSSSPETSANWVLGLGRNADEIAEINTGVAGTFGDLKLRTLFAYNQVKCMSGGTPTAVFGPPSWDTSYAGFQNGRLAESPGNAAFWQDANGGTTFNAALGQSIFFRINNDPGGQGGLTLSSGKFVYANGSMGVDRATPVCKFDVNGPIRCGSYTVLTVPAANAGAAQEIYVSDEAGGAVLAFSDATNWRRVTDRAVIS